MNRKEEEIGRRPLLYTFVGNNRQMLQEIRDNLSHLRKTEGDEKSGSSLQAKTELSQSTPNLVDKSSGGKMTRLNYHQKALAEIAESLRPYQTVNSDTSSTSSASSTVNGDGDSKQSHIGYLGYDEETGVFKIGPHRNLETIENINKLKKHVEGRNGNSKISGLGQYPKVIRKQSFESKYGPSSPAASDTNSVRSDSPGLNNIPQRHPILDNLKPLVNGHQTPPPLPPRAPIVSNQIPPPRGQTPPPSSQADMIQISYQGQMNHLNQGQVVSQPQPNVIQPGHVQNMIKVMSPLRENAANQQALMRSHFIQQQQQQQQQQPQSQIPMTLGGTGQIVSQSSISPVTSLSRQVYGHNGQSQPLSHQVVRGTLTHNGTTNTISQTNNIVPPRGAINIPPSQNQFSQAPSRQPQTVVHIHGNGHHEHSHLIPSHQAVMEQEMHRNMVVMSTDVNSHLNVQKQMAVIPTPTPVPAAVRALGATNPPIIMHSVKSKEVQKPVPQQATIPTFPPSNNHANINQNYISSVQTHVNGNNAQNIPLLQQTGNNNLRKVQIHLQGQNGINVLTPEQLQALTASQGIQIHIQNPISGHNPQNQFQNLPSNYDFYIPRSWPDTPGSTPRSDSPVSRATNQSPLSVISTTSSPSTNSDIPDKPPPPYPGRTYATYGHVQGQGQPPLPPRVPLKPQGINQTPPPPQYPQITHPHPLQMVTNPPGLIPTSAIFQSNAQTSNNVQLGASTLAWSDNVSDKPPPLPPPPQSRQPPPPQSRQPQPPHGPQSRQPQPQNKHKPPQKNNKNQHSTEPGDDTDTDTVSSDASVQETTRCMSPIPERRPEARERDRLRRDTKVRNYSPQAFKFFMEQHVENVLKSHDQRLHRRFQLENEMTKVGLSDEAATQMRRMLHQKESNYIRLKRAKMDKLMFDKLKTLGVGAFGEVSLVCKRDPKTLYAMKTLRKTDVIKRNQVAHVKAERDILAEADNEWVVKLYYSFQDHDHLYFVMDYVPGGDLMGLLIKQEILDETLAKFYIAELVLAIESVHKMGFIHRDIKPDNILIDRDGHIKLTDFGLCTGFRWTHNSKYYQKDGSHARQDSMEVSSCNLDEHCRCEILKPLERRRNRERQRCLAHSLVGTPNYIAPEVLLRQGYSSVCDWWSVGVILFEMLVGHPPFYATSPIETQQKVIHWKSTLKIPLESNLSWESSDLILRLLCGAEDRLGSCGAQELKTHVFFSNINLEGLRKTVAPFIPKILYPTDTSNFDPVDPDKLRNSDSEEQLRKLDSKFENGKHTEHAFYEFTFRRFFDDAGHPCPVPDPNSPVYV